MLCAKCEFAPSTDFVAQSVNPCLVQKSGDSTDHSQMGTEDCANLKSNRRVLFAAENQAKLGGRQPAERSPAKAPFRIAACCCLHVGSRASLG